MSSKQLVANWFLDHITLGSKQSPREEFLNGATHVIGAVLAAIGTVFLVYKTSLQGDRIDVVSMVVYGLSMLTLYASSASYHLVAAPVAKRMFRVMDHLSIYLLIAGTYTPVVLGVRGWVGWALFAAIWVMALVGVVLKFGFWGRYRLLHVAFYVVMGWMIVVAWGPIFSQMPRDLVHWSLAGGITYTVGTIAYSLKSIPYQHTVWHLFVLGGSVCFFVGIYSNIVVR